MVQKTNVRCEFAERTAIPNRRVFSLFLLLLVAAGSNPLQAGQDDKPDTKKSNSATTVRLVIDYGDGVEKRFTRLPYRDGMTAFDLMQAAAKHPRGIHFKHQGKNDTTLLLEIDGVTNEGGSGKNWIFRINKKLGARSFGITELKSGDTMSWSFETYP